jgi:hypothetical protein
MKLVAGERAGMQACGHAGMRACGLADFQLLNVATSLNALTKWLSYIGRWADA